MTELDQNQLGDVTVVKLRGSLTGEELEPVQRPFEAITRQPGARVVVDLAEVDIVTTPALSMFIAAAQAVKRSGGRIVFTESRSAVRDVLNRLRLRSVLTTASDVEEALCKARAGNGG